jgi:L-lactate dehydrogenase complex protein LldG
VLQRNARVPYMHHAYQGINAAGDYGFSLFIADPSKAADIEQPLVLGAHRPKMMTVFLIE